MIIAVDFDGCLCSDRYPKIGKPNYEFIEVLCNRQNCGDKIILWTCRTGKYLDDAVRWCNLHGLRFDAINDDVHETKIKYPKTGNRKIFADVYADEKSVNVFINNKGEVYEKSSDEALKDGKKACQKRHAKNNARKTTRNK